MNTVAPRGRGVVHGGRLDDLFSTEHRKLKIVRQVRLCSLVGQGGLVVGGGGGGGRGVCVWGGGGGRGVWGLRFHSRDPSECPVI